MNPFFSSSSSSSCVRAFVATVSLVMLGVQPGAQVRQTSQDEYTLYELLAPDTASFRIDYEVTATTAGASSS